MANTQLKDIAQKLGMSISTVSRAVRNSHEVSQQTRELVREMAAQLNYRPNPHARSLRSKKTKTIAVLVPDISNHFFALALRGIEMVMNKEGFHPMIFQTNDEVENEKKILDELENGLVDGVLLSAALNKKKEYGHITQLMQHTPVVFYDRAVNSCAAPQVTSDNFKSAYKAALQLSPQGADEFYFIGIDASISVIEDRLKGFTKAMKENGQQLHPGNILFFRDQEEAYASFKNILQKRKGKLAFFCAVERYALILYQLCAELKIRIPRDLRIISFSNNPYTGILSTPLSVVVPPAFEIGKRAADMLLDLINERKIIKREVVLPCTLTLQQSSAVV